MWKLNNFVGRRHIWHEYKVESSQILAITITMYGAHLRTASLISKPGSKSMTGILFN